MNKLLIGLLAFGSISTFAGSIISQKSSERVDFELNKELGELKIISNSPSVSSRTVKLTTVQEQSVGAEGFRVFPETSAALYKATYNESYYSSHRNYGNPYYNPELTLPFTAAIDVVALPFRSILLIFTGTEKSRDKKDYNLLKRAIVSSSDVEINVSEKRFSSIAFILSRAIEAQLGND